MFKSKAFILGFAGGMLFFFWKNLFPIWDEGYCSDVSIRFGFPLSYRGSFCDGFEISRIPAIILFVNILTAIIVSIVVGLIFNFVHTKITKQRLK